MNIPILSILTFLPLAGVLFLAFIPKNDVRNTHLVALWISGINFCLACALWYHFDAFNPVYQFVENVVWIEGVDAHYRMGVDGISLFFVLLSALLTPLCVLYSWHIQKRPKEYMMAFLLLETFMIGSFLALDLLLFFIFFEGVLIPMFLIIGIWGGERRVYSTFKFFLFTLVGSIFMLLALAKLYTEVGSTDMMELSNNIVRPHIQYRLWLCFFLAFAVKIPMWPLHTWLPDAHVEAPTAGSVLLAGVLLKLGGYGMVRFMLPLLPDACLFFSPYVQTLSVVAILYASCIALVQTDMKKLIAYSSVAHMGFVTLGIFTQNVQGVTGAIVQMISHGLISAALFFCVGIVYERFHTREINYYGGLATLMPRYATFFMLFTLASIGLPGTSGFVGEFFVLLGTFKMNTYMASIAALGLILGAAYMLSLYRDVCFGKVSEHFHHLKEVIDLRKSERLILSVLAILIVLIGIYPCMITDVMNRSVRVTLDPPHENKKILQTMLTSR